ncbi:MAG: VanZ family protein [Spirochaetales bacterium]|nr:VanZ family protein [Spirochaetales bacterium]
MFVKKTVSYILFPICTVIITALSLYPGLPEPPVDWDFFDKIEHTAAYLVLAAAGILFFKKIFQKPAIYFPVNAVICMLLGGIIELIQPLTGRHADILDFLMNTAGVIIVILAGIIARLIIKNPAR